MFKPINIIYIIGSIVLTGITAFIVHKNSCRPEICSLIFLAYGSGFLVWGFILCHRSGSELIGGNLLVASAISLPLGTFILIDRVLGALSLHSLADLAAHLAGLPDNPAVAAFVLNLHAREGGDAGKRAATASALLVGRAPAPLRPASCSPRQSPVPQPSDSDRPRVATPGDSMARLPHSP